MWQALIPLFSYYFCRSDCTQRLSPPDLPDDVGHSFLHPHGTQSHGLCHSWSRADQRGGVGRENTALPSKGKRAKVFLMGCPAEQTLSAQELRVATEMRQISLVTASICGGGHTMPNRQCQVPGKHKQQRACVLQQRVVRGEGKGLEHWWHVKKRKGKVALT